MRIVDFHSHFYPPAYLDALKAGRSSVRVVVDADGNPVLHYPGDYNVAVQGHRDVAYRETVLERESVDVQVLTLTTPGTHVEAPARAVELARLVNDALADAARRPGGHGGPAGHAGPAGHFAALATLPLNDPAASAAELTRAVRELGMRGAMLFSNVNGVALADPRYEPLWRAADQLEAVLFIHPTNPVGVEAMTDYWLMPLVGFPMDTTLAAAKLVFAGVPDRYPRIRWVLGHLGGAIPYLAERLDRGYAAFKECRAHLSRRPSEVLRTFFFDTVNFDVAALRLAVEFAGACQLLAGSDYPHQIGSIPAMLASLRALDLPARDRDLILGGNAARLLGL
jgi:aminocarboxymuconate-semialdehyde decarboxylase